MWRRKKGNGSNLDGQSTVNCIVMGMRVFGDFHIIIKYIATPLHEYDYYYRICSIISKIVRPGSFSKGIAKCF